MTLEKRAQIWCDSIINRTDTSDLKRGYIQGAVEQKAIDKKALKLPWVSIEDEEPNVGQVVIISNPRLFLSRYDGQYFRPLSQCGYEQEQNRNRIFDPRKITHWIPVPDVPEMDFGKIEGNYLDDKIKRVGDKFSGKDADEYVREIRETEEQL